MKGSTNSQPNIQAAYPIGSIYMNASNNTNPATLLGFGTWTALAPGRVLMGAGTDSVITGAPTYTAGDTVGEYSHTLSTTEMPSHGHSVSVNATNTDHTHSGTTGAEGWNHYHDATTDSQGGERTAWGFYNPKNTGYGGTNVSVWRNDNMQGTKWDGTDSSLAWSFNDAHTHWLRTGTASANHSHSFTSGGMSANASHGHTVNQSNAGGGGAHNNVQPSLVVYMWVRTA